MLPDPSVVMRGQHDKLGSCSSPVPPKELVGEGLIRWYGWSTDDPERARVFAAGEHCTAVEFRLNLMFDAPDMLALCDASDLAAICKSPLNGGILTGKVTPETTFPENDGRVGRDFTTGRLALRLRQVKELRPILTRDGRTLTQAALAWILDRSDRTIPIPGFKTVAQVEENVGALGASPLDDEQLARRRRGPEGARLVQPSGSSGP